MPLKDEERTALKLQLMAYHVASREERLDHFAEVAPEMCSARWRRKFREFVERVTPATVKENTHLVIKISNHSCIEGSLFEKSENLPGCKKCRDAFWKLVLLTAKDIS